MDRDNRIYRVSIYKHNGERYTELWTGRYMDRADAKAIFAGLDEKLIGTGFFVEGVYVPLKDGERALITCSIRQEIKAALKCCNM